MVAAGVRLELAQLVPSLLAEGQLEGEDEAESGTLALRLRVVEMESVGLAMALAEDVRAGEWLRVSVGVAVLEALCEAPSEPVALCARLPLEDPVLLSDTDTQVLAEGLAEEEGEKEGELEAQGLGEPESEGEEEDD